MKFVDQPATARRFRKSVSHTTPLVQLQLSGCKSHRPGQQQWSISVFGLSFRWHGSESQAVLKNPMHCPRLAEYMRSTYFTRFPLWSRLALGNRLQASNAIAEAGARILKQEESLLPQGSTKLLPLDEFVSARIPIRIAQSRLLVTQVKRNLKRLRDAEQTAEHQNGMDDELMAKETWSKRSECELKLSGKQLSLVSRFVNVAKWRKQTATSADPANLDVFSKEIGSASTQVLAQACSLSRGKLSQFQNRTYWPTNIDVVTAIENWVTLQEAKRSHTSQHIRRVLVSHAVVSR